VRWLGEHGQVILGLESWAFEPSSDRPRVLGYVSYPIDGSLASQERTDRTVNQALSDIARVASDAWVQITWADGAEPL
jgi:hypothetical protein